MASMTVRLVSGRKMRASLLCMPQSSAPHPLSGKGSCRAGTDGANRAPSVGSSLSGIVAFLGARRPPERVEQAVVGDFEHPPVDLAPGGVLLVVRRRGGLVRLIGGGPAAQAPRPEAAGSARLNWRNDGLACAQRLAFIRLDKIAITPPEPAGTAAAISSITT